MRSWPPAAIPHGSPAIPHRQPRTARYRRGRWCPTASAPCSTRPPRWPTASPRPASGCTSSAAACATPSWAAPSTPSTSTSPPTPGPTTSRRSWPAGPTRCGPGQALRHDRRQDGRPHLRDHHPPGRGVRRPTPASPTWRSPTRSRPTCPGATSRSTPWRSRCPTAELIDPFGGAGRPGRQPAAHAAGARGVVQRRPAADAARRPVHRRLRAGARPRAGRGGEDAARPAGDRLGRAHPRRARQADGGRATRPPACGSSSTPGWPRSSCPSCRRCALEQDPIHRHKDVLAHTIAVVEKTRAPTAIAAPGRAAARRRQAQDPLVRPGRGVRSTTTRWSAPAWPRERHAGAALPERRHRGGQPAGRAAPAVPHLQRWAGPTAAVRRYVRDAGPLLDELNELTRCDCTTRNERKAARAGRRGWTSSRTASPSCASRRSSTHPARPRRPPDHGAPRPEARSRWSARRVDFLLELRLEEGPLGEDEARRRLDAWWAEQQERLSD